MTYNALLGFGSFSPPGILGANLLLQDTTSTQADDRSGNARHGTINGMGSNPVTAAGPNGYLPSAFDLDGTDDFVVIGSSGGISAYPFTIGCWVRGDDVSVTRAYMFLGINGNASTYYGIEAFNSLHTIQGRNTGVERASGTTAPSTSVWHHVVGVFESATSRKLYVNGVLEATGTGTATLGAVDRIHVGKLRSTDATNSFDGRIAGVGVFTDALTLAQIEQWYNGPEPLNTVAPAAPSGTQTEGETLTADVGTWDSQGNGTLSYSYQWTRSNDGIGTGEADISGATSATYVLDPDDIGKFIRCRVRASNLGGFDAAEDTAGAFTGSILPGGGTFPDESDVRAGVVYGPTNDLTGTLVVPAANTVLDGTMFGPDSLTEGTVVLPAAANVLDGTMFGPASATEGTATVPPVGKVINSETYGAGGTALTGTYAEIAASLVTLGNQYGAGGTQYTGTVRVPTAAQVLVGVNFGASDAIAGAVVLPGVGDVRTSVTFGPSSGSTGTLSLPGVGSVLSSASYGAGGTEFVGTFVNVADSSVVLGVQYGANGTQFTGTVRVPTAAQVLVGVSFGASDALSGTVALPAVGNVRSGVTFGPGSGSTGTVVIPTQSQVLDGVSFDTASTGNVVLPTAGQVLDPVTFGPAGATTGTITLPSAAQVLDSITFGPGAATTGTVVLPSVGDVRDGTFFGPASTLEGTLDADIPGNYPSVGQVLVGVVFGDSNEFTGTYVEVAAADVRDGVLFGPGSSLEGTLVAGIDPPDSPLMSAVSVLCLDEQGLPASGVSVDLRVVSIPAGDTNVAYRGNKQTAISGVDGIATIEAPRGSRCQIKRGPAADWKTITIADAASTDVESIIGSP